MILSISVFVCVCFARDASQEVYPVNNKFVQYLIVEQISSFKSLVLLTVIACME